MDINQFLQEFEGVLLDEHKARIMEIHNFLSGYIGEAKKTSIFGEHYISCLWANDTTTYGPDTCVCFYVESNIKEFKRLERFYKRIVNYNDDPAVNTKEPQLPSPLMKTG